MSVIDSKTMFYFKYKDPNNSLVFVKHQLYILFLRKVKEKERKSERRRFLSNSHAETLRSKSSDFAVCLLC